MIPAAIFGSSHLRVPQSLGQVFAEEQFLEMFGDLFNVNSEFEEGLQAGEVPSLATSFVFGAITTSW